MRVLWLGAAALLFFGVSSVAADVPVSPITISVQTADIHVASDGSAIQDVHAELHAENDVGALRLNQVALTFNTASQDLTIIEAYTLKTDGTKVPVDMSAIFTRLPPNEAQSGTVSDLRSKVIVFPQLAAGDTAVYSARFSNHAAIYPGTFTYGIVFNPSVPIKELRDTITAPKTLGLRAETHGVEFTTEDQGQNVVYRWHYSSPTAIAATPTVVSPIDHLPRYFVSNFADYAALGRAYGKLVNSKLTVTPKVADLAEKLTAGENNRREQVRKLYEWVNANIHYIAIELGNGTMVPHNVDDILTYGYGDCKDHDLLLRALLQAKGINSKSVLLNGANAYTLTQVPTFVQLNHVITSVPELGLLLDSSALATPFGVLPFGEYGKPAIYIGAADAIPATTPALAAGLDTEHTSNVMHLSSTGVLTGTTVTTATGPSQVTLRTIALALQAVSSEQIASQQLQLRGYRNATGTLTAGAPLVRSTTFSVTGHYTIPGWQEWLKGTGASIMPLGLRVLGITGDGPMGPIVPQPSIDFSTTPCFSVTQSEDNSLEIPAGYQFAFLPPDAQVTSSTIEFSAHWSLAGNVLSVHREFRSKAKEPLCTAEVRRQTARTLEQIAHSYLAAVRIVPATRGPALVSELHSQDPVKPIANLSSNALPGEDIVSVARLGDMDRAAQMLDTMNKHDRIDVAANTYAAHLAQGLDFLSNSQLPRAVEELSEAIRMNPAAGPKPYSARATAYSKMNENRLAIADIEVALKSRPNDLELRQLHAELLMKLHNYDGAAADYNLIVRSRPHDPATVLRRADIRYHAEKYEEAVTDYRNALRLGAPATDTRPGLCNALARTDLFGEALDHCSWTLRHDTESVAALESRGAAHFRLGHFRDALDDFNAAVKLHSDSARYLYERGLTARKLGLPSGQHDLDAATKMEATVAKKLPTAMLN